MAIEMVKIRAKVSIGRLSVETPYVQSFNVRKQRGQVSSFDASLKVSHDEISGSMTGGNVVISAGENSASETIFTGICKVAKISPCYDDPKYVILSISGVDQLSLLQGKRYTRRCRSTTSTWVAITGVVREGFKSGKFTYKNEPMITIGPEITSGSNVVGHVGASATPIDKTKVKGISQISTLRPPEIQVEILNTTGTK